MSDIWEFFEDLDEIVYATDIETNEIVYLNSYLRDIIGVKKKDEYIGRKCYELLQGKSEPCEFCNNNSLECGKFKSWSYTNSLYDKNTSVKDTLIEKDRHKYRIEIAIDEDAKSMIRDEHLTKKMELLLIECMRMGFSDANPDIAINHVLEYLGKNFKGDRTYLFEIYDNGLMSNTYEWCAKGIESQMNSLQQDVAEDCIGWWLEKFRKSEPVIIEDLEEIKYVHPETYGGLKPQNITSLCTSPIEQGGKLIGYLGIDNPDDNMMSMVRHVCNVIGYVFANLLKQRDSIEHLQRLSYRDAVTGVLNRNALFEDYKKHIQRVKSVGVIFCDVTGLKQVNDSMGHYEGDNLLKNCCNYFKEKLESNMIYRIGGDEFVALVLNKSEDEFKAIAKDFKDGMKQSTIHMAVGYTWTDKKDTALDELLTKSDHMMYEDKQKYYAKHYSENEPDRRHLSSQLAYKKKENQSEFDNFISNTYCDFEAMCQSMTKSNSSFYLYFGDMQKDLFYISDNMKELLGFQGNVVPGLLKVWEEKVSNPEHLEMYRQDIADILENKRTVHDLRYQIRDVNGNDIWIRCYGILKWNEDKSAPLFFSGRVSCQDSDFIVDPLSNFLRDETAVRRITQLKEANTLRTVIGFSLNRFTEINNTKGRAYGNRLIQLISNRLLQALERDVNFYRLDGMNFLAIVNPDTKKSNDELVAEIRKVTEDSYKEMSLSLRNCCSCCVIDRDREALEPTELLSTVHMLIKSAKNDPDKAYVQYSKNTIEDAKVKSVMSLVLVDNVMNGMENFRVVVQPVVAADGVSIVGGEVLLRWNLRDKPVSPAVFIPLLERENMIQQVGRWVFRQAVRACRRTMAYDPNFYLSFNVSLQQLSDTGFVEFMKKTLDDFSVSGTHLVAELTEANLDEQPQALLDFVDGCKNLGIRVALDDFGNAYSSLRMLLQYPSDIVKLDRSLLTELTESKKKLKFIRSIVFACHQFDKKVCVEGVESSLEKELVVDAGCDTIQGFYYYRPMEVNTFYQLLSDKHRG